MQSWKKKKKYFGAVKAMLYFFYTLLNYIASVISSLCTAMSRGVTSEIELLL